MKKDFDNFSAEKPKYFSMEMHNVEGHECCFWAHFHTQFQPYQFCEVN